MIREKIADLELDDIVLMDGFDDCVVGLGSRFGSNGHEYFAVYDRSKIIEKMMKDNDWTFEEAQEYHEYNQQCLYAGPTTWAFIDTV